MFLKQYYLGCLSHASYLIGDEQSGAAVVVDPQRDVDLYLADAAAHGLTIRHVFLTHFHADFLAGHLELRARTGAEVCLGARAEAEFPFRPFADGASLDLGQVRLTVLETPGHTPEAVSILVTDRARDPGAPHAVLTGDTLFIGDVGRPDLMASRGVTADALARALYRSLRDKLLPLPDATLVYPAHGAGSLCGRSLSKETVSTIGEQRRYNYALQPMSEEEFVRLVTADQPESPRYFSYDADLNRRERATLDTALAGALQPLALDALLARREAGAQVLDTREPADFAGAHLAGSVNIALDGQYASWAGTLLDPAREIVLVAEPGRESESAVRLGRIGFDRVAGYLESGAAALGPRPELMARTVRVTALALAELLQSAAPPLVLDVRTEGERRDKRIPGALHVPLSQLPTRLGELPRDRRIAVHCASGYRSSIAASLLERAGFTDVLDVVGGMAAWEASRLEVAV